jgi:hypothetical protein
MFSLMPFRRRIIWLLLLPLLIAPTGAGAGGWHCADGTRCASAAAVACCCGCVETGGQIRHQCEQSQAPASLTTGECGCYYHASHLDPLLRSSSVLGDHAPALLPVNQAGYRPPAVAFCRLAPADDRGPPGYLVSPRDTRGPPAA